MKKKVSTTETKTPEMEPVMESQTPAHEEEGKDTRTSEGKEAAEDTQTANQDHHATGTLSTGQTGIGEDIVTDTEVAPQSEGSTPESETPASNETNPEPGAITDAPQHPEHLDMSLLGQSPALRSTYIRVSDDAGQLVEAVEQEAQIKSCQEKFETFLKGELDETPENLLAECKEAALEYAKHLNQSFAISEGAQTKARIRLGMHFLIMKKLVRKSGKDWTEWFDQNFDERHLRSIQDYMQLAKVPNIIRYAVFSKGRLLDVVRGIGKKTFRPDEDPIADFLARHQLVFDPESEEPLESWRTEIDTAVALDRVQAEAQEEQVTLSPDRDLIKKIVGMGIPVNSKMIADLIFIEENHGDINLYMESHYVNGGKSKSRERSMLEDSKALNTIQKVVAQFKSTVDYFAKNSDLAAKIDLQHLDTLEAEIRNLRALRTTD